MNFLLFIIVIGILVFVHEFGHFIIAKSLGVKVEKFSLGFGPTVYSRMYRGTEFMICLIPLGGFVKMAGEERLECKGHPDEYFSKPPGHRALIILMGPIVNYFLAYICFFFVFLSGYPTLSPTIGEVLDGYPAQIAGLQVEDRIVQIDGLTIKSWEDVQQYVLSSSGESLNFVISRSDAIINRIIVPQQDVFENIFGQKENVQVIGIKPKEEIITLQYNIPESMLKAAGRLGEITGLIYKSMYLIVTGSISAKDSLSGPIGIFEYLKKAASQGFIYLLSFVGLISASLAVFNLLPIPVLDGGHLFILGIEKIRGKALPEKIEEAVTRLGFSLIICLACFVFYNDFVRFGWFDKITNFFGKIGL